MRSKRISKPTKTNINNNYEKQQLFSYLATFLSKKTNIKDFLIQIGEWYEEYGSDIFKYEIMTSEECQKYYDFQAFTRCNRSLALKRVKDMYQKICTKAAPKNSPKISRLQQKIDLIAQLIKLSEIEKDILGFYIRTKFNDDISNLNDNIFHRHHHKKNISSFFLPYTEPQVENVLGRQGKLISCDLLEMEYNGDVSLSTNGAHLLSENFTNIQKLRELILGKRINSTLNWEDFKHIKDRKFCSDLLAKGIKSNLQGLNILLYGEPGTGKTEFAKTLCAHLNAELYAVGEKVDDRNRLAHLNMIQNAICHEKNVCLLIDEADDLMSEKKIYINRILETNKTPCIWIVNSIRYWDKAYLRRFTYAIDFKKPDIEVKQKIWQRTLEQHHISIDEKEIKALVKDYNLPLSFIVTAAKSAKIVKGGCKEVRQSLEALEKAYNDGMDKPNLTEKKKEEKKPLDFNVSLLNTDTDLGKLAEQIKALKKNKFSLCLYGVSGTGKSAYAEYLAEQLKMPIIKKRCSDLFSKFVGESEQNIARAFEEAKDKHALLVFDEADSFLYNRENSMRSWEFSQVNEMLTQMEKHEFPFVCTTNLMDNLDKACLRRFTFKVEYKYMTSEQNSLAFEHFFKMKDVNLSHISTLTPGDFVVVKEKAEIMGYLDNKDELIKMLEMEQRQKTPAITTKHIGFL